MSLWKLFRKDFALSIGSGLDADLDKFPKQAMDGELVKTSDSDRVFVATSTAGVSDATKVEIATLKGNTAITAASPTLDMTDNNKVIPVDASSNAVDFQVADDEFTAGFRCILQVKDGTNNISLSRSGSTATINGGTTKSYTTPAAYTHVHVTCAEDNELVVSKSDP